MEEIRKLDLDELPKQIFEIPHPPSKLYIKGVLPPKEAMYLTIIGSRKYTTYGKDICEKLIRGLKGYPIIIVSGLALGMDGIVHKTAIEYGLTTVAFPGSGLDNSVLHPRTNLKLSEEIIKSGGCIISEMEPKQKATLYSFPQRNRLMAGISKAVLIIEAEEKSGTLITARMATDYNRDVLAVPGSILSQNSYGTNWLIRQGATPITKSEDILEALGFDIKIENKDDESKYNDCGQDEKKILALLREPKERDELIRESGLDISTFNSLISIMEIKELIKEEFGEIRRI